MKDKKRFILISANELVFGSTECTDDGDLKNVDVVHVMTVHTACKVLFRAVGFHINHKCLIYRHCGAVESLQ